MTAVAAAPSLLPEVPEGFSNAEAVHWVAEGGLPLMEHHPGLPFADDECAHGRLPTDGTPMCGCWPGELEALARATAAPVEPDLMTTLKQAKEAVVDRKIVPTHDQYDRPIGPARRRGRPPKPKAALALVPPAPAPTPEPANTDPIAAALAKLGEDLAHADLEIVELGCARHQLEDLIARLEGAEDRKRRINCALDGLLALDERPLGVAA